MKHDLNWKDLKEEKVNISFNMGLEMALFVLEMAEGYEGHQVGLVNVLQGDPIQFLIQKSTS